MSDLRSEVIYALQQPLIRLSDTAFNRNKKMVKKVLKNQARVMGAGTHYVLDNDLLDVIDVFLSGSIHPSFVLGVFVEFDGFV